MGEVVGEEGKLLPLFMDRMYGMPRAHGRAGAAMYRMYGMPRAHGRAGAAMDRMYGLKF